MEIIKSTLAVLSHIAVIKGATGWKRPLHFIWTLYYFLFLMAFYKVLLKLASLAVTLPLLSAASSCHVSGTSKTLESQVIATWKYVICILSLCCTSGPIRPLNCQLSCLKATGLDWIGHHQWLGSKESWAQATRLFLRKHRQETEHSLEALGRILMRV